MGYYEKKREETLEKISRITLIPLKCAFFISVLIWIFFMELFTFTEGVWDRFEWIIRVSAFSVKSGIVPLCIIYQIFYRVHCFFKEIKKH